MTIAGFDHVQVAAPPGSEAAARSFYGRVLGLREIPKPPGLASRGGVWFVVGDAQLHVGVAEDFQPARKAHPALRVSGAALEPLARALHDAGHQVVWDGAIAGERRFFSADPWSNRIEFVARD